MTVIRVPGLGSVVREDRSHGEINADLGADPTYTARVDSFLNTLGLP